MPRGTPYEIKRSLNRNAWRSPEALANWLRKFGFQIIGTGRYGTVWAKKNENIVIKITDTSDRCFIQFVEFCIANKANTHLPKILWARSYVDINKYTQIIVCMERLSKIPDDHRLDDLRILTMALSYKDFRDNARVAKTLEQYKKLYHTLSQINHLPNRKCKSDFHANNFMIRRSTNEIVVIDGLTD